jgi:zinc-ribbon domain
MFCPKCAAQNVDGASFCRVCGANISLVPHALSGTLPAAQPPADEIDFRGRKGRRKRIRAEEPASLEKGIVNVFAGIGFIVAALAIMFRFPGGIFWGWTFFIPAFDRIGRGIASIVAAQKKQAGLPEAQNTYQPPHLYNAPPPVLPGAAPRNTGEMVPQPASVTEGTTRHLGQEAATRHLDSSTEYQK